jgi:WD40 repeat protein
MAEPLAPGDPIQVGTYRLLGRLGEGGMGHVYLGSTVGGRLVAVKVIAPKFAQDPEFRARFAREVAAARLVGGFHTAQVVDADTDAAAPWMASAYIRGLSLHAAVAASGPMRPGAVIALGAALAEGLTAIHSCGLVHRDLKPSNVILADDGPRIIDFGIVRSVDAHSTIAATGFAVGTAPFMSPEQVSGKPTGPASDVFSLGSVLAYAATGHGPFDAAEITVSMYRVRYEPPDLGAVDGPLRAVLTHCLAKDPAGRPPLHDLLNHLAGLAAANEARDAIAEEPGVAGRERWQRMAVAPLGTTAASQEARPTAAMPVPSRRVERRPPRPRRQPQTGGRQGAATGGLRVVLDEAEVPVRQVSFSPNGRLLAGLARRPGGASASHIYLWDVAAGRLAGAPISGPPLEDPQDARDSQPDSDTAESGLRFSPDGRFLAFGNFDGSPEHSRTGIWDLAEGRVAEFESHPSFFGASAFSPDGKLFAAVAWHNGPGIKSLFGYPEDHVFLWELKTGLLVDPPVKVPGSRLATGIKFTPDGRLLIMDGQDGVRVRGTAAGSPVYTYVRRRMEKDHGWEAKASPDGRLLAVCQYEERASGGRRYRELTLWDTTRHMAVDDLYVAGLEMPVAFSPVAPLLAAYGQGLVLLDTVSGERSRQRLPGPRAVGLEQVMFSPDGRLIAACRPGPARGSRTVMLRETAATGTPAALPLQLAGYENPGPRGRDKNRPTMRFSPDSRHLAVSRDGEAGSVHWWDLAEEDGPAPRQLAEGPTPGIAFSPDSRLLAAATGGEVRLWRLS